MKLMCDMCDKTIDAIPVEWLEWRIMNAKHNGIKEAADAFEFVLKCWEEEEAKLKEVADAFKIVLKCWEEEEEKQ